MKHLDRYIVGSLTKLVFNSVLLIALVLVLFDIFSHLDQYISHSLSYREIGRLTFLYLPQAICYALGPAALFSTTYVLAMLHANNEMIILSNIGYSFQRIITPILIFGILLTGFQFIFSEYVAIPALREKGIISRAKLGQQQVLENRNITLQSPEGNYIIYARHYNEDGPRVTSVILVIVDAQNRLQTRIDAASGTFNGNYWVFKDATQYLITEDGSVLQVIRHDAYHNEAITMEPALFRNLTADITTMELEGALRYVQRIKMMNAAQYADYASDLASRVFGNISPLILILISCSTLFTWRKNVLILSILSSLSIAVVFFVMQMLSMIFAKQGLIAPVLGPLAPMGILVIISIIFLVSRRI